MKRYITLFMTHCVAIFIGFVAGIYTLPILLAPSSPSSEIIAQQAKNAMFTANFTRELRGSDFLHWGEGAIHVTENQIIHEGSLAPGPDYKLYLVKEFVEHEDEFLSIKDEAIIISDIKSFNGFIIDIPDTVDMNDYNTILIWCEAFSEFITAAQYKKI